MMKIFSTPKKTVISILCIIVIVLIIAAAVSAIVVKSAFIGKEQAQQIALTDAGLNESDVSGLRARLDYDDGRFCYDVDFYSSGTEYDYSILAKDGDIVSRDVDGADVRGSYEHNISAQTTNASDESQQANQETTVVNNEETVPTQVGAAVTGSAQSGIISEEQAKAAALTDAGLAESDVTFLKVKLDTDDRIQVYEIEFYTSDMEYDYEIYAADGTVKEKNTEAFRIETNDSAGANSSDQYIGVDRAKEIALNHAGLTEAEVQFSKAKLENDDGTVEYDVSFYYGNTEYEYTIHAVSGEILEYDYDHR